jgi:hypothetical protein
MEMNAAERIRRTSVHQDFARDFHKWNSHTCGGTFPKFRLELRKTG